ncbi:MAG: carbonic anhydrase [Leptospiraceae bacterium]|nr:carbonic anhydrase [Leptospiraceae bacterium]
MFHKIKYDFPASIVVFLVALPLCLGVALASGAPLLSGLISGIVGGIIVGLLSGSHTSVSGPAAGLTAVVLSSINELGSFEVFLASVVLAGIFQVIFGVFRGGFISAYIPSNVIKGLLAAIGIILILKQIPHAVGFDIDAEDDFSFLQPDGENTFSELLKVVYYVLPGALIISSISLVILYVWDRTPLKKFRYFPSSLFVVLLGVGLNQFFIQFIPELIIEQTHLVNIPKINVRELESILKYPDFSQITNYKVWTVAYTVAIIASLETLLNLEAVDNIDPQKRHSPPNRELVAQGIGNIFSGIMGGIPVTSVIVRSSINIQSGNRSKVSSILHGFFLLVSVLSISRILNLIPLSSLAAILIFTGYKLAKISLFKEMYLKGKNQFFPFVATIIAIVFTDLLIGILIGLAISIAFILRNNYRNPFTVEKKQLHVGETLRLELSNQATFLNKATIKDTLWHVPAGSRVIIDASYCDYVDHDILELIQDFQNTVGPEKNIQVNVIGIRDKYQLTDNIQFVNVLDKKGQEKLTPDDVLEILKHGNLRFVEGQKTEKYYKHQVNATSDGQYPMAVVLSCIDSRTSPEIILDAGLGDLVSIRIAGNIINDEILGSIEIACEKLGTKLIVVMGHSKCGAIKLAANSVRTGKISAITDKIELAISQCDHQLNQSSEQRIDTISWLNVHNSVSEIIEKSKYVEKKVESGDIKLVSAFYEVETGKVIFER